MKRNLLIGFTSALVFGGPALAQQDFSNVEIETVPVAEGLYMLVGQGGNIALSVGEDGTFIVDTQFAGLTDKIQAAVNEAGGGTVDFVVNTHWHGDHVGGNANFANAGATVIAHNNVQARMSTEQISTLDGSTTPPSPPAAIPVLTFPDRMTFHYNGNRVNVIHVPNAHTDGDSIIHYTNLNAFHMGDTFFNGTFPFIDVGSAGSLDGIITAAEDVLARANDSTQIIPGHGPLATREDLVEYHSVLTEIRDRIQSMIDAGRTEDDVVAANPTAEWNDDWGGGFMNAETFTRLAYQSLDR